MLLLRGRGGAAVMPLRLHFSLGLKNIFPHKMKILMMLEIYQDGSHCKGELELALRVHPMVAQFALQFRLPTLP